MKSRAKTRTKTRPLDWIVIQWARACEERLNPNVAELERVVEVDRDAQGRLADPTAYLHARAVETLKLFDAPVERWLERLRKVQIASVVLVVALGAVVFPFARVKTILGDEVNLAGPFLFFLVTQIFFLLLALVFAALIVAMGAIRRLLGRDRPVTFSEKVVQTLSSVVGSLAIIVVRRYAPVIYNLFGRPSRERFAWHAQSSAARRERESHPEVAQDQERRFEEARRAGACFWDVLFSRSRMIAFWGCALSHMFWASCSICVLLILAARMQGNRYDYCWHTSLEDERVVKKGVDILGAPIAALGGTVPSESDVAALFDDDLNFAPSSNAVVKGAKTKNELEESRRTAAETRARWSYFLLAIVFLWCIVPRLLLVAINALLYRHAERDFRPALDDPFFRAIIDRAEEYRSTTLAVMAPESDDDKVLEAAPIARPAAPIWNSREDFAKSIVPPNVPSVAPVQDATKEVANEKKSDADEPTVVSKEALKDVSQEEPKKAIQEIAKEEVGDSSSVDSAPDSASEVEISEMPNETENTSGDAFDAPAVLEIPEDTNVPSANPQAPSITELHIEESVESKPDVPDPKETPEELEERRQASALSALGGLAESVVAFRPQPQGAALAFCYDVNVAPELIRELIGEKRELTLFGDVADFDLKKSLREYLDAKGSDVALCVVLTDVGLPPARHFVRFMRDVLTPALSPAAKIVVVLSGGERMRLRFATTLSAVGERVEDWTKTLEAMATASGKSITPTFYYDAELNLPEPRARLHAFLNGGDELEKLRTTPRSLMKWDAATKLILQECRAIFDASPFIANDETERLRVSRVTGEIFKIYSDEVGKAAFSGRASFGAGFGAEAAKRFAQSTFGEGFSQRVEELGLSRDFIESRIMASLGLSGKLRSICGKLSPKCALAAASVGVSVPVVVAFAPLLGGAITTSALLTTLGAVGSALPASLASGAVAGALGALAPEALKKSGAKLMEKISGGVVGGRPSHDANDGGDLRTEKESVFGREASVATLVCSSATWAAALELQGLAEDAVATTLPEVLKPLEDSPLDNVADVETALTATRAALAEVPLV